MWIVLPSFKINWKKNMKGHLDSFFLEREEFPLKEESYETCEYDNHGNNSFY